MAPSQEFYTIGIKTIGPNGFDIERTAQHLLAWQWAQIPDRPNILVAEVHFGNKKLWGVINVADYIYGAGHLELPVSLNNYSLDYPGLRWMVTENSKALKDTKNAITMFHSLGLKFNTRYGRCETSTSSSGFGGVNFALEIYRSITDTSGSNTWRNGIRTRDPINSNKTKLALSAAGVADVINDDLSAMDILVSPISYTHINNEQAPH